MKTVFYLISACMIAVSSAAWADSIVIEQRFVVPRDNIAAQFYAGNGSNRLEPKDSVILRLDTPVKKFTYVCVGAKWDWNKVETAAKALSNDIDTSDTLLPTLALSGAGYLGCHLQ
ncbi:hypothetical protein E7681_11115 [Thalassobius vesicularis]|uniref:Uncharacterized protein n=1 Tax=Thalassobius vesicularis TaxID=1294297 RepID=A0A4S3M8Q5_9RHOB|nr:hypothetical protein [Thalassobius vesicularis]THD73245.1 hypothetical protein E7681_11115 [Thalassobius vesicularis]